MRRLHEGLRTHGLSSTEEGTRNMSLTTTALLWLKRKRVERLVKLQLMGLAQRGLFTGDVETAVRNVLHVHPLIPAMRSIETHVLAAMLLARYAADIMLSREDLKPYVIASLRAFLSGYRGIPGVDRPKSGPPQR